VLNKTASSAVKDYISAFCNSLRRYVFIQRGEEEMEGCTMRVALATAAL